MEGYTGTLAALGIPPDVIDQLISEAWFGVYMDHPTEGCVFANQALLDIYRVDWESFRGFGWALQVDPRDRERLTMEIDKYEQTLVPFDAHFRIRRPDGELRWVHARVRAVQSAAGSHIGSFGLVEDDTANQVMKQEQYGRQKLEALGQLSARLAHDFNNLLAAMQMAADTLSDNPTPKVRRISTETLHSAIEQAAGITGQLLTLSRRDTRVGSCELDREITRLVPLLKGTLGEAVTLDIELGAPGCWVPLEPGQLGQAIVNLSTNAKDAMEGRGRVSVRTHATEDLVWLEVADHGAGIAPEQLPHVFTPFFTTKDLGRGTGLGLSIVKDLVETAGGQIHLESEVGIGTTLTVQLGRLEVGAQPSALPVDALVEHSGECILIVDDNDALRQQLAYAFAVRGWRVLAAADLAEAQKHLEASVGVLIADVMLPDGSGVDLMGQFRAIHPGLPVILMSGFASPEAEVGDWDKRMTCMLRKPFRFVEVQAAANRLLAGEAPED